MTAQAPVHSRETAKSATISRGGIGAAEVFVADSDGEGWRMDEDARVKTRDPSLRLKYCPSKSHIGSVGTAFTALRESMDRIDDSLFGYVDRGDVPFSLSAGISKRARLITGWSYQSKVEKNGAPSVGLSSSNPPKAPRVSHDAPRVL